MKRISNNMSDSDKERIRNILLERLPALADGIEATAAAYTRLTDPSSLIEDAITSVRGSPLYEKIDAIAQTLPKQRKDAGQKHSKRQPIGWRSRKDVAADFDRAAFFIKGKRGKMGRCSPRKIMDWDRKYPDPDHLGPFGYHAQLHLDKKFMDDYKACLQKCYGHCANYKRQYEKWLTTHPHSPRSAFRFNKDERLDFERDIDEYC